LKFGVSATFSKIYVGAGYELGLVNTLNDSTIKDKNWIVNGGYNF
jgi:hypothetical protein